MVIVITLKILLKQTLCYCLSLLSEDAERVKKINQIDEDLGSSSENAVSRIRWCSKADD